MDDEHGSVMREAAKKFFTRRFTLCMDLVSVAGAFSINQSMVCFILQHNCWII